MDPYDALFEARVTIESADCPACGELGSMAIRIVDGVEVSRKCYSDECYL